MQRGTTFVDLFAKKIRSFPVQSYCSAITGAPELV